MVRFTEKHIDPSGIKCDVELFVLLGNKEYADCGFSILVESGHSRHPAQHGGDQPLSGHEAKSDATFQPTHELQEEDN